MRKDVVWQWMTEEERGFTEAKRRRSRTSLPIGRQVGGVGSSMPELGVDTVHLVAQLRFLCFAQASRSARRHAGCKQRIDLLVPCRDGRIGGADGGADGGMTGNGHACPGKDRGLLSDGRHGILLHFVFPAAHLGLRDVAAWAARRAMSPALEALRDPLVSVAHEALRFLPLGAFRNQPPPPHAPFGVRAAWISPGAPKECPRSSAWNFLTCCPSCCPGTMVSMFVGYSSEKSSHRLP